MAFTLTMPEVGETVTEGTIEKWLKQPGDQVTKYEPIVEINTDKVNVELPSPVSGKLLELLAEEGETVEVGAALATIEPVGDQGDAGSPSAPQEKSAEPDAAPAATGARAPTRKRDADSGRPRRATPRVRTLARELNVDLDTVEGTGPGGRIIEDDVRASADTSAGRSIEPAAEQRREGKQPAAEDAEAIPLTGVRRTIAKRMSASAFSAPHAWLVIEADVTRLVELRTSTREQFQERHGVDLTYLPFAAHTAAQALLDHPYLNASWAEDRILLKKSIHLGIAVATDRGLMVPVIRDADRLSISGLARAINELGARTRDNKLKLEDVQGGTFTLDNTGAFGSLISMPIINQGQSAILTLEAITRQPRVVDGDAIAVRSVVNICLSFDHRVLDGHQAGAFLQDVKDRLEAFEPGSGID